MLIKAKQQVATVPVMLGWLHASNAGLVARPVKRKLYNTFRQDSNAQYRLQHSTVVFSLVRF